MIPPPNVKPCRPETLVWFVYYSYFVQFNFNIGRSKVENEKVYIKLNGCGFVL